jgi:XisH protein
MAAKDRFHDAVQRALEKDGWTIVASPLTFKFGNVRFEVDLAADRLCCRSAFNRSLQF